MIAPMRRWLVLLMLVLLPLRGWVGEAMAGEMVQQTLQGAHSAQMQQAADHDDCAGHDEAAQASHAGATSPDGGCGTCASCQACSAVALVFPPPAMPAAGFSHAPPVFHAPTFASAERQLAFKPPKA